MFPDSLVSQQPWISSSLALVSSLSLFSSYYIFASPFFDSFPAFFVKLGTCWLFPLLMCKTTLQKGYLGYDTKLYLMVRLQFWRSGECIIPFHCHYCWVYSDLEWSVPIFGYPVGWSGRIHRLYLCRGVRPPHITSVLDMTLNNLMVRFQ